MKDTSGNALFLILIAVALFAALSYAITSSGRGGSGVDKEKAEIIAAEMINVIGSIQSRIMRLELIEGYKQVQFNDSAENNSGTCYTADSNSSPCRTIGLFNDATGQPNAYLSNEFQSPNAPDGSLGWGYIITRTTLAGQEVGTTAPDHIMAIYYVDENVCDALNKKMNGVSTKGAVGSLGDNSGWTQWDMTADGTFYPIYQGSTDHGASFVNFGCVNYGGGPGMFDAYFLIKQK